MAARIAFVFLAAVLIFQVMMMDATVIRRDVTDPPKNSSQTIDEALQSFKSSLDDIVKNIQGNELVQNVSQSLKNFGEQVQQQGKQLVDKIQSASKTK